MNKTYPAYQNQAYGDHGLAGTDGNVEVPVDDAAPHIHRWSPSPADSLDRLACGCGAIATHAIVLATTDAEIVARAAPATWDGVRHFEVLALKRLSTDPAVIADCDDAIQRGGLAKDALRRIAATINAMQAARS